MNSAVMVASDQQLQAVSANEMKAHVQKIQQVMAAVMKPDVHYGKIPGAGERMSLFKPGAEVLCVAFRIAPSYAIEDLSDHDSVRYRVKCTGTHQNSLTVLGEGVGEASSNEEKYKWRAAVCKEEWDATPEDRRRRKWRVNRQSGNAYDTPQIRTEPADIANTVLKMAAKRAQVAMSINVTGASDIFSQDLEDLPEEMLGDANGSGQPQGRARPQPKTATQKPQARNRPQQTSPQTAQDQPAQQQTAGQAAQSGQATPQHPQPAAQADPKAGSTGRIGQSDVVALTKKAEDYGMALKDVCAHFKVGSIEELPVSAFIKAIDFIVASNEAGARG
jgi:hypothetical protein